ncbi:MAG: serine/threonine-protein kinase [Polyangiaceae bacterium]
MPRADAQAPAQDARLRPKKLARAYTPSERDEGDLEPRASGMFANFVARCRRAAPLSKVLALPFGSVPLDSNEGREFLRMRLAFFSKTLFYMGAFAFVASLAIHLSITHGGDWITLQRQGILWHVLSVLTPLFTWIFVRRVAASARHLFALDGLGTAGVLVAYSTMAMHGASQAPERASLLLMLITVCTVIWRAITVPSTPGHTLAVTAFGCIPILTETYWASSRFPSKTSSAPFVSVAYMGVWVVLCLAITGVASQLLYGLRAQVVKAQQLGQYVLEELIGEGGMGVVYKASHALLRRPTAIKLVIPERVSPQVLVRFEREVQLTAMLTHPNTVNVYDYGHTADGTLYYAMEYLDGIDLEQLVDFFGAQPSGRVVRILEQVAGSLSEAHQVGLVHRDIKPANVILCNRGGLPDVAKVVDFGLVKDVSVAGNADPTLTNTNSIIGTPLYLAPEAILTPDSIDARSDLYALGAVGYFLLTGQPVFTGGSVVEICVQHVHGEPIPPSTRLGAPVPAELEALILRCLGKKPGDRPQSAEAFLLELAKTPSDWTREQATAWWRQHAAELNRRKELRQPAPETDKVRDTLLVDYGERVRA